MQCPRCKAEYPDTDPRCPCGTVSPTTFPGVRHFFTKVVGVTHKNKGGRSRQAIIKEIEKEVESYSDNPYLRIAYGPGTPQFVLVDEPENPADENAIKVLTETGDQIGYLSRELAADVAKKNKEGFRYTVILDDITGGFDDAPTRGVNLLVMEVSPGTPDQEGQRYFNEFFRPRLKPAPIVAQPVATPAAPVKTEPVRSNLFPNVVLIVAGIVLLLVIVLAWLSGK